MGDSLATKIQFKKLCDALEEITKASTSKKANILEMFIQQCRIHSHKLKVEFPNMDVSLFPVLRLILPQLERERGAHNLKQKSLANLYVRVFCLGKNSKDANNLIQYKATSSRKIGGYDFAEKACSILQNRLPRESSSFTIERVNLFLDYISSKNETIQQKGEMFKVLLGKTSPLEFKWLTRIILKDVKLGIGTKKILQVFHPDANSLFDVSSNLRQVCDTLYDPHLRYHHDIKIFSHFKPMLLERCRIEDVQKLFVKGEQYFVQNKYDGERSQIHMKDGKFKYFTRQGHDITQNSGYGETSSAGIMSSVFGRLLSPQVKSVILDGELMGWHKEKKVFGSKGMNYDVKRLSENSHHQPYFIAFDIIMHNDILLDDEPYEKRLEILKGVFKHEEGCLSLCKSKKVSNSEDVYNFFNECLNNKEEGIVVKKCSSKYKPNVRDGTGCYKIKAEYSEDLVEDVDLIMLGAYYGDGKFSGMMKSFLMGVAYPPTIPHEHPTKFISVVSVSNGLSMDELKTLWKMFEGKWQKECPANVTPPRLDPPDLWVRPKDSIILTVRATEMLQSKNYPTGYTLRFPRVLKIRTDKPWYGVCTTNELLSLIKDARPIQKLTKREANYEDINEAPEIKVRRTTKQRSITFEKKPGMSNAFIVQPVYLSRLFDNKEICVINGNDEFSKEQIEEILLQHRAKVVQNPLKENYCIIVGNIKTARAKIIIQSKKYNVVTVDWFKRAIKEENWSKLQDFLPWDLISTRESTKHRLAQHYDNYYDHYTINADEESLLRSLRRIEETAKHIELDHTQLKEIDQELFDDGISPHSLFRSIVGYFNDQSDPAKFEFRFMAGTIEDTVNDYVTHIFISRNSVDFEVQDLINNKSQTSLITIKSEWIRECFKQNTLVSCLGYLIQ